MKAYVRYEPGQPRLRVQQSGCVLTVRKPGAMRGRRIKYDRPSSARKAMHELLDMMHLRNGGSAVDRERALMDWGIRK